MKKSLQILSLILILLFVISGTAIIVCNAEPGDDAGGDTGAIGDVGGDTGGGDTGGGDVGGDTGGDTGGGDIGGGDIGGDTSSGNTGYDDSGNAGDASGAGVIGNDDYSDDSGTGYNSDDSGYYSDDPYYDPDPISYGNTVDGSYDSSDEQVIKSDDVAAGTNTIKSSGISDEDVKPNKWSEITLNKDTSKEQDSSPANFKKIKENTNNGDDSFWMLYLGYALIVLAGLGILYFIVATIAHRSAVKKAERLERRRSAHSPQPEQYSEPDNRYREPPVRKNGSRHAADMSGQSRRSAKADTGEVYVPRRAAKRTR